MKKFIGFLVGAAGIGAIVPIIALAVVVSGVSITPNPTGQGDPATLTATVSDAGMGDSIIISADYNIDGGPWSAMLASDGLFDEVTEEVSATISSGLAGVRTVCVRGTDATGEVSAADCESWTINADAVNGGGALWSAKGKKAWTFGSGLWFAPDGSDGGHFEITKHDDRISCNLTDISDLIVSGTTATFTASGPCNDGTTRTLLVKIVDNGEPGTADTIEVSGDWVIPMSTIGTGNFQVNEGAYDRTYTLFADGSIGCPGADDLSDPDGYVTLMPTPAGALISGFDYTYTMLGAEPLRTYGVAVSQEPTCAAADFPGSFPTDASGDGTFSGFYAVTAGSYNMLMNSSTAAAGLADPKHREISTENAWVTVF